MCSATLWNWRLKANHKNAPINQNAKHFLYQAMPNLSIKSPAKFRIGIGNSSDMIPQKKTKRPDDSWPPGCRRLSRQKMQITASFPSQTDKRLSEAHRDVTFNRYSTHWRVTFTYRDATFNRRNADIGKVSLMCFGFEFGLFCRL